MSRRSSLLCAAATAFAFVAAPAFAEEGVAETTVERKAPHFDVGLSGGINNPAGIYGAEVGFRPIDWVSIGLGAGNGAWGFRLSPLVRVYPFGASNYGLFVEGGLSMNLGGNLDTTVNGELVRRVELQFTPVVDAALGWRFQISKYGFIALRAGYGVKLGGDNNYKVTQGDQQIDLITQGVINLAQPGGIMGGLSGGVTFF